MSSSSTISKCYVYMFIIPTAASRRGGDIEVSRSIYTPVCDYVCALQWQIQRYWLEGAN